MIEVNLTHLMSTQSTKAELSPNRSMPSSTVIPVIGYPDVREATAWLSRAFGFVERLRIGDHRVQLDVGDGSVVITRIAELPHGRCGHAIMVRIADVDAHAERAASEGARITNEPTDYPYGERQYSVEDIVGHQWTFSQSIADVDPATWGGTLMVAPE
jgi:uncharacterized glyoxalase superfamily protein PhnB